MEVSRYYKVLLSFVIEIVVLLSCLLYLAQFYYSEVQQKVTYGLSYKFLARYKKADNFSLPDKIISSISPKSSKNFETTGNRFKEGNAAAVLKNESMHFNKTMHVVQHKHQTFQPNSKILDEILNVSRIKFSVPVFKHMGTKESLKVHPGQCESCGLVLSSGYLKGAKAGLFIDSKDCVFRFNDAPVKGFEDDVGFRTTFRLFSHSSSFEILGKLLEQKQPNIQQSVLLFYPSVRQNHVAKNAKKLSVAFQNSTIDFYLGTPQNVAYFQRYFIAQTGKALGPQHIWLSTGFIGLVIGLHLCNSITIYGAVRNHHCQSGLVSQQVPYHYYPSGPKNMCSYMDTRPNGHLFFEEHHIYDEWSKRRKIVTLFPSY